MKQEEFIKYLEKYEKRFNDIQFEQERIERHELCMAVQSFNKQRLLKANEESLVELISPLWAIRMWGNKQQHILKLIEQNGLEFLCEKLVNLLYGTDPLETRWDDFRKKVKGMGPAIMSELLCKTYPDRYILWNRKAVTAFKALGINVPNYQGLDGESYVKLSEKGQDLIALAKSSGHIGVDDFLSLDYFFWHELQDVLEEPVVAPTEETETKKQKEFVHNDIRDLIMEIGGFLGFESCVEKLIASGAKVDAVWQASIGNMGMVIYVFEVQTSGSIDSLVMNLMKAKANKAVQGIVAVTDEAQIEKIKKEIESLPIRNEVKFWDYKDVIKTHEALSSAMESINNLGLVPNGMLK